MKSNYIIKIFKKYNFILFKLTGYGIKCYSCESVYDENCGKDFELEPHFKLDCDLLIPPRYLERKLAPNKRNATGCLKRIYEGLLSILELETIQIF